MTVPSLTDGRLAICLLDSAQPTRRSTSVSRAVRRSSSGGGTAAGGSTKASISRRVALALRTIEPLIYDMQQALANRAKDFHSSRIWTGPVAKNFDGEPDRHSGHPKDDRLSRRLVAKGLHFITEPGGTVHRVVHDSV